MENNITVSFTIDRNIKNVFEEKCKKEYGEKHTNMIREMIISFNEDRIKITPTIQQKKKGNLYNEL